MSVIVFCVLVWALFSGHPVVALLLMLALLDS